MGVPCYSFESACNLLGWMKLKCRKRFQFRVRFVASATSSQPFCLDIFTRSHCSLLIFSRRRIWNAHHLLPKTSLAHAAPAHGFRGMALAQDHRLLASHCLVGMESDGQHLLLFHLVNHGESMHLVARDVRLYPESTMNNMNIEKFLESQQKGSYFATK